MFKTLFTIVASVLASLIVTSTFLPPPTPSPMNWDAMMDGVVVIKHDGSTGSGFFLPDGRILTANHVVEDTEEVEVTMHNGTKFTGLVAKRDTKDDLAIVVTGKALVVPDHPVYLPRGIPICQNAPVYGEEVFALGAPLDFEWSISRGIVSNPSQDTRKETFDNPMLQVDALILPGNSGGPIVSDSGCAYGTSEAGVASPWTPQVLMFAVRWQEVKAFVEGI